MHEVIERIVQRHTDDGQTDNRQLDVIFSRARKLAVYAPAGYGKTRTLVSKIAYLIATGQVPHPKQVLALTFSVNAACSLRSQVAEQLPDILSHGRIAPTYLNRIVVACNYHGLSRRILARYGYLVNHDLQHVSTLRTVDESSAQALGRLALGLSSRDIEELTTFADATKRAGNEVGQPHGDRRAYIASHCRKYLDIVAEYLLPNRYITFNGILLFARALLNDHLEMRAFYRQLFPVIVIDEFQDTNLLQWTLLQDLLGRTDDIREDTWLSVFGDPLQRIYGFIGAIPGVMGIAACKYSMCSLYLQTNHRFNGNDYLLNLDANIRANARTPRHPDIRSPARVHTLVASDQDSEVEQVYRLIRSILRTDTHATVAVLFRLGRNNHNTKQYLSAFSRLRHEGFSFFHGLYTDVDDDYVDFHLSCFEQLLSILASGHPLTFRSLCTQLLSNANRCHPQPSDTQSAFLILLQALLEHVLREYKFLDFDEKVGLVRDVLDNRALKHYLTYVNASVVLSTVHGAKGLEWDYVILPDMERYAFPSYRGLCEKCSMQMSCDPGGLPLETQSEFARLFFQELSVFYVAATRARSKTFFSYSTTRLDSHGKPAPANPSCFLRLPGICYQQIPHM